MSNHDHAFVPLPELVLDAEGWTTGIAKCSICGDVVEFWDAPRPRIPNQSVVTHHQPQRPITTDQVIVSGEQSLLLATSDQSVVISDQPSHPVTTALSQKGIR